MTERQPTHGDIQRDMGRMEGKQDATGARLDKLEKAVSDGFEKLDQRLARIEATESQRKGALTALALVAGAIGSAVTWLASQFMGAIR